MNKNNAIILKSLLITILIFSTGIILNHFFDFYRIDAINTVMRNHELDTDAYRVERLFTEIFEEEACDVMTARFFGLKEEIKKVGADLSTYSRFSIFRKTDYDALKREYILLQLKFYALLKQLNTECGQPYLPILFFYQIDQDESERQGFILEDLATAYNKQLVILSIDKDYTDEPLVPLLVQHYNITRTPAIVVNEDVLFGLQYVGQINSTVQQFIRRADPYANEINFLLTPEAAGINFEKVIEETRKITENESLDSFARGDAQLIIGRLSRNSTAICESLAFYDKINSTNPEERALAYETIASLGCGRNRAAFLKLAAIEWKKTGNKYRAQIIDKLSNGERIKLNFDSNALSSNVTVITGYKTPIVPKITSTNATTVTIGNTKLSLNSSSILVSQDDRVYRDWLSGQLSNPYGPNILTTFSERLTYDETELLPNIGWHEGARIREFKEINLTHKPAVGTLIAKYDGRWFAVDDNGIFRFEVPIDKISYPTTRFLRPDLAVAIDTHGMNMMVEQAIRNNATAVIACCDHPGKIYAAEYLSDRNITSICYPDKYLFLALGHDINALGSPPQEKINDTFALGNRPINITLQDRIVAVNSTDDSYALWYYQTPTSYFSTLSQFIPLNITYVAMNQFEQMNKAVDTAHNINATIIATRIFNKDDYTQIKNWLYENSTHKAILFHSAPYPYGQLLFKEFANQTSFDDPNPIFQ